MTNYYDSGWNFDPFEIDPLESTENKRAEFLAHTQDQMKIGGASDQDIASAHGFTNDIFAIDDALKSGDITPGEALLGMLDALGVKNGMTAADAERYASDNWDKY